MWATAQRDGCPAKYRWRPLFNAAKFGWRPLLVCRAVTLPRHETRWNLHGCPKLANRSQPLVGRSSPYCEDVWRRYCCLTNFFPIVATCLSCEDIARQICTMVRRWRIFGHFCVSCIQPVVKPAVQRGLTTGCSFKTVVKRCLSNRLYNPVNPVLTTGWTNSGCSFNTVVQQVVQRGMTTFNTVVKPVVKRVWQPAVSCKWGIKVY